MSNSSRTSAALSETLRQIKEVEARPASPERDAILKRLYEVLKGDMAKYEAATDFLVQQLRSSGVQFPR